MIDIIKMLEKYNQINWILNSKTLYAHIDISDSTIIKEGVSILDPTLNEVFWFLYIKESINKLKGDELVIFMSELDQLDLKKSVLFDTHMNLLNPFCKRTVTYNCIKKFEVVRVNP